MPRTAIRKIWDEHVVKALPSGEALIAIDRVFLHERTGPAALQGLRAAGYAPMHRELVFGTMDHIVDTLPPRSDKTMFKGGEAFIGAFRDDAKRAGIRLFDLSDPRQGIVHVVSPEQGIALPGLTLVCPDSHTCTVGGLGALAWGIGSTEGEHAIATQTLVRPAMREMRMRFDGVLAPGVGAKDMALAMIARFGSTGGAGHVIEYAGDAIRALDIEGRLTLCNLTVEFGAWTGLVAPDEKTIQWSAGRPFAPSGENWERAVAHWRALTTDDDAQFDTTHAIDCSTLVPQVTWGTNPEMGGGIDSVVPDPSTANAGRDNVARALEYMDLKPGQQLEGTKIDAAFIGSCTNSRLPDLREAAAILKGRKVAPGVKALVVPGSTQVKRDAEAEGLDRVFKEAGFEWRESGCSLCFFAGGDNFGHAKRVISSTNRNFEGRQGVGVRTHLASPATVAASAIAGSIADPRKHMAH
ncbi:MAG: 3-isopropylmalate dehydratase large subunit [Betaproteobacteria bacterium]|nr:3-isopropylmalate dehydratase large subunit [Betaproteobacteria bacterium]